MRFGRNSATPSGSNWGFVRREYSQSTQASLQPASCPQQCLQSKVRAACPDPCSTLLCAWDLGLSYQVSSQFQNEHDGLSCHTHVAGLPLYQAPYCAFRFRLDAVGSGLAILTRDPNTEVNLKYEAKVNFALCSRQQLPMAHGTVCRRLRSRRDGETFSNSGLRWPS